MTPVRWADGAGGFFQIDGRSLEYRCVGPAPDAAPTLVMLHEGLGSLSLWRDFPDVLAAATGLGVFAWSRFGYGQSEARPPPWPLDYMEHEATVALPAVLAAIGFRRGVLVGHSDGASIVAIHAGAIRHDRIRGLVLIAPHFFTEPGGQASIAETAAAFRRGPLRDGLARHHRDADATFLGWSGAWLDPGFAGRWNIEPCIDRFQAPVLAIQGAEDEYGTLSHIEALERRSPQPVERLILPGCRHSPHREKAEETVAAIARFARRVLGP